MSLTPIFKRHLLKGKTGQLVIKFAGDEQLCKVYVEDGNAVYMSMGNRNPDETIGYIVDKEPEGAKFIVGVSPVKRLDEPLNDKLLMVSGDGESASQSIQVEVDAVSSQKVDSLVDDFIDIVGPLGVVLSENIISDIGYIRGTQMSGESYSVLLSALFEEVPAERKNEFKNRHI